MNSYAIDFTSKIDELFPDANIRTLALSFATAATIARSILLPKNLEEAKSDAYNQYNLNQITKNISTINEKVMMDTSLTEKLTKKIFMVRFFAVFPREPRVSQDECIMCDLFDISSQLQEVDLTPLQAYKGQVFELMSIIYREISLGENSHV